ncbi:endo-1,4-beta-xylanase [Micromonospora sp. NPDC049559]|uniref:endo-1,4-beta-xylanase n=1 Tax=Micromonospora sp. NPDC049559 TaxID=3155923 RepID=UPI0034145C13
MTPLLVLTVVVVAAVAAFVRPGDPGPSRPSQSAPTSTPAPACTASAPAPSPSTSLRALAAPCGLYLGAAVNDALFDDPAYRDVVAREFNGVTPESALKWGTVEPRPGEFNFAPGDAYVEFAERNGQRVHGHTLVWHTIPAWVTDGGYPPDQLREILRRHVQNTVAHWRGRIDSWDVVNEPLGNGAGLRDSVWLRGLGPGYIADSFRWAREADPDAKLFINDFDVEGVNAKSDYLYQLVKELRAQGVPIDGVGFQTHVARASLPESFEANLRRFADLGVEVAITELDVRLPLPPTQQQLETQAGIYARVLRACLAVTACRSVTTWGFTDRHSWVGRDFPGQGAALPFDESYRPKPAYWSLHDTLVTDARRR